MSVYPALLLVSAIGCAGMVGSRPSGVRELVAATLAVVPIMALIGLYLLR